MTQAGPAVDSREQENMSKEPSSPAHCHRKTSRKQNDKLLWVFVVIVSSCSSLLSRHASQASARPEEMFAFSLHLEGD